MNARGDVEIGITRRIHNASLQMIWLPLLFALSAHLNVTHKHL